MSRIGKLPVDLPKGVTITVAEDNTVTVKGPLGQASQKVHPNITVSQEEGSLVFARVNETKESRSMHGLYRMLVNNMVVGLSTGFTKELTIVGTGYRAQLQGSKLVLTVGYSHPVEFEPEVGMTFEVPQPTTILVKGNDKQRVGEIASQIRKVRPPEPYLGKGIRYANENVRRKEGKAAK